MTSHQLSVALIEPIGGHGGMSYYDFGLCEGLVNAGCAVSLYTCDKTEPPRDRRISFHPIFVGIYGDSPSWLRALRYLGASVRTFIVIALSGQKICHFHFFHGNAMEALNLLLSKLLLRKVVITLHDVESFGRNVIPISLIRRMYSLAGGLIVHNQACKAEVIKKLGIQSNKIRVIHHGNYLHSIDRVPDSVKAKTRLGISAGKKVILFFGQIKEAKGLDVAIEAMPRVLTSHPDTVLLIAGRPWRCDYSRYEKMMDELGIRDQCVSHIHYIADGDVPDYYGACDLVLLPYRRIYQSGVVLMAMSYGKTVVVSDLPGMTEIVKNGENGLVFKNGDIEDLAQKIIAALGDDQFRRHLAKKGYESVRDGFNWNDIGIKTKELYASLGI